MSEVTSAAITPTAMDDAVYRKITRRFIPLLFICYIFNYMDRTNIGFAQLQMKGDLGFSDVAYGIGAGIFFISYSLFALPSNLIMDKVGARKTILGCLLGWGLTSISTMFVHTPHEFYAIRFLLGIFEAGFFPGIALYFTLWYPSARRGKITGIFMSATVAAGVVSGLLSGAVITYLGGCWGLRGWQWMFLVEGLPSAILGIVAFFYLDDRPRQAKWLTEGEKKIVADRLEQDPVTGSQHHTLGKALLDYRVYLFGLIFFLAITDTYVLAFWQPLMIRAFGIASILAISLYSTIPSVAAVSAKIWVPYHSDLKNERRWHFAISAFAGAIGLFLTTLVSHNPLLGITCLVIATAGVHASIPVFWAVPGDFLSGAAAAGGFAVISMMGTFGGAVGPPVLGWIKSTTGSFTDGMYLQSLLLVLGGILMIVTVPKRKGSPTGAVDPIAPPQSSVKQAV
jgi:MFS family permease